MNFIGQDWIAIGLVVLMIGMSRGGLPIGVMLGYLIVRLMPEHYYIRFIYVSLSITSVLLIYRAITGP